MCSGGDLKKSGLFFPGGWIWQVSSCCDFSLSVRNEARLKFLLLLGRITTCRPGELKCKLVQYFEKFAFHLKMKITFWYICSFFLYSNSRVRCMWQEFPFLWVIYVLLCASWNGVCLWYFSPPPSVVQKQFGVMELMSHSHFCLRYPVAWFG